jgi:hypothetical protein
LHNRKENQAPKGKLRRKNQKKAVFCPLVRCYYPQIQYFFPKNRVRALFAPKSKAQPGKEGAVVIDPVIKQALITVPKGTDLTGLGLNVELAGTHDVKFGFSYPNHKEAGVTGVYNSSTFNSANAIPVIQGINSGSSTISDFTFRVAALTPLAVGTTAVNSPTTGYIRNGTTQYYIVNITAATNYNLVFRDVASANSTNYADVSVSARYSNAIGTVSYANATGNDVAQLNVINPPSGQPGWVILQVESTDAYFFESIKSFGIRLYN